MVSTPYYRGRSREYQVIRKLRSEGWLCSRSAASHGPVDVFAAKEGKVILIQVKSGKGRLSQADKEVLRVWAEAYHGRAEAWFFRKRSKETVIIHDATVEEPKLSVQTNPGAQTLKPRHQRSRQMNDPR
jgi:Holliday junction resolvase